MRLRPLLLPCLMLLPCLCWAGTGLPALPPGAAAGKANAAATRTVYRCLRDGTVSLATAAEPGSRCTAISYDANSPKLPDLWQVPGAQRGVLYQRQQDGRTVYGTRELPGSTRVLAFAVPAPPESPAHAGLGSLGPPQRSVHGDAFRSAARVSRVDEAWLRAIAHVESGFDPNAVSPKGALGVMQLMPDTAAAYEVTDAMDPNQSIQAGARHLAWLMQRYRSDLSKVAAAYNAGPAAVDQYQGVPPFAETRSYVDKVLYMHQRYLEQP